MEVSFFVRAQAGHVPSARGVTAHGDPVQAFAV